MTNVISSLISLRNKNNYLPVKSTRKYVVDEIYSCFRYMIVKCIVEMERQNLEYHAAKSKRGINATKTQNATWSQRQSGDLSEQKG